MLLFFQKRGRDRETSPSLSVDKNDPGSLLSLHWAILGYRRIIVQELLVEQGLPLPHVKKRKDFLNPSGCFLVDLGREE